MAYCSTTLQTTRASINICLTSPYVSRMWRPASSRAATYTYFYRVEDSMSGRSGTAYDVNNLYLRNYLTLLTPIAPSYADLPRRSMRIVVS